MAIGRDMQLVPKSKPGKEQAGEINTPLLPPSHFVPSPPTGHVQMAEYNLPGDKGQTCTNPEKVTQLNERHIFIENILCVRPCAKNFALLFHFNLRKAEIFETMIYILEMKKPKYQEVKLIDPKSHN